MANEAELQEALDAVGEVLDLIDRQDGDVSTHVTARMRRSCSLLATGDLDGLRSLLSEMTGGMGSLNDYGFISDVDHATRDQKTALTAFAAEKCRIALRSCAIEPWR